jgi:uncharacterized protein YukE
MTKMGMDVEAVESVGRQLKQSAASVESLVGGIDKTVSGLTGLWDGPDAQRFVQQSWPTLRKALVAAQSSVEGLGQSALNNASEQRESSKTSSSGSGLVPWSHLVPMGSVLLPMFGVDFDKIEGLDTPAGAVLPDWAHSILGKHVDMDGLHGAQCVDLVNNFANKLFPGVPWSKTVGATEWAKDMFVNANGTYFDKLPVGSIPNPGDIVCIAGNPGNGGAGHVAVVETVGSNGQIRVVEQNGNNPDGVAYSADLSPKDTAGIQGFLRAKAK